MLRGLTFFALIALVGLAAPLTMAIPASYVETHEAVEPGICQYYCQLHHGAGMVGQTVVED